MENNIPPEQNPLDELWPESPASSAILKEYVEGQINLLRNNRIAALENTVKKLTRFLYFFTSVFVAVLVIAIAGAGVGIFLQRGGNSPKTAQESTATQPTRTIAATSLPSPNPVTPTLTQVPKPSDIPPPIMTRTPTATPASPTPTQTTLPTPAPTAIPVGKQLRTIKVGHLQSTPIEYKTPAEDKYLIVYQVPISTTLESAGEYKDGFAKVALDVWVAKAIIGPGSAGTNNCVLGDFNVLYTSVEAKFGTHSPQSSPDWLPATDVRLDKKKSIIPRLEQGAFSPSFLCEKLDYPQAGEWAKIKITGWFKSANLEEVK